MAINRDLTWKLGVQDNASSGFSKVADSSESMGSRISGAFSKVANAVGGELGELIDKGVEGFGKIGEAGTGTWTKLAAGSAVVAGLGVAMSAFASKGQAAEAQLKVAVENTGDSFDEYESKISKAESAGARFGDTNAEVANALQVLVQATGDTAYSIQILGIAYDLAADKHESLNDAVNQLAKIYNGSGGKILKSLGIDAKVAAGDINAGKDAIQQVGQVVSGQAAANVDNFSGKFNELKTRIVDAAEKLSGEFGPAIGYFGTAATIASGVLDLFAARAARAAVAEAALAQAEKAAAEQAAFIGPLTLEASLAQDKLALSGDAAAASQGRSKLAMAGMALGAVGVAVGLYEAGNAINDYVEKNNSLAKSFDNVDKGLQTLDTAYQKDGNTIGANTKQVIAASLAQSGLEGKAAKAGITLGQLTTGVTGTTAEFNHLVEVWKASGSPSDDTIAALGVLYTQTHHLKGSTNDLADATKIMADQYTAAITPILSIDEAIKKLQGSTEDLSKTEDGIHLGLNKLGEALDENSRSLTGNTTGAITNRGAIEDQIDKINTLAQKQLNAGGSVDQVTAAMKSNEDQLLQTAKQLGLNAEDTQALINKYALVPANVKTTIEQDFVSTHASYDVGYIDGDLFTKHATGGILGGGTVNEGGNNEMFNLPDGTRVVPYGQTEQWKRDNTGSAGNVTYSVTVQVQGTLATDADIQRAVAAGLEAHVNRGGTLNIGRGVR